jgi:hypothetical protein
MDDSHKKPDADHDADLRIRPCLICKSPFPSEWHGERICRRCKSSVAWRSGVLKAR